MARELPPAKHGSPGIPPSKAFLSMSKTILVTGASGFIGSHTCVELLQSGFDIVALDNLCNSSRKALDRVRQITGKDFPLHEADIRDRAALDAVLSRHRIDAVIHFAG